jgi:hypothetical protein
MLAFSEATPGHRLLEPPFMLIQQAMGTKATRQRAAGYLADFIARSKAGGLIRKALADHGHSHLRVP